MIQFDEYVSNGSVQPPPSDPFNCLDMRFPPNTCRHGKIIDFQCLGSGAKWSGVGVPLDFSVNFTVVWGAVIPKKNIEFYSKGNPSLRMTQQFLEFPRLLKHHQIHPQKLLGIFEHMQHVHFENGWFWLCPHVSTKKTRFLVASCPVHRAKRKKADKAGKESQIRLCPLDPGTRFTQYPPLIILYWLNLWQVFLGEMRYSRRFYWNMIWFIQSQLRYILFKHVWGEFFRIRFHCIHRDFFATMDGRNTLICLWFLPTPNKQIKANEGLGSDPRA